MEDKVLDADDFKELTQLYYAGKKLEIAAKLAAWENVKKTELAEIFYRFWVNRMFPNRNFRDAGRDFEKAVVDSWKQAGCEVTPSPIVDFVATDGEGRRYAVECKKTRDRGKIFEGIAQLLYYRWMTGDTQSHLILTCLRIPNKNIHRFAASLGVIIYPVEDMREEIENECRRQARGDTEGE